MSSHNSPPQPKYLMLSHVMYGTGAPLLTEPLINSIAAKHSISPASVLISYHTNHHTIALPKSVSEKRIVENLKVFKLDEEDMQQLDGLWREEGKARRINTPAWGWDLGFEDWYGPVGK